LEEVAQYEDKLDAKNYDVSYGNLTTHYPEKPNKGEKKKKKKKIPKRRSQPLVWLYY